MIKIAICDDEKYYREYIERKVGRYLHSKELEYEIDLYRTGQELIKLGIEMSKYHIIFLDINMNDMDGIETAQQIRQYSNSTFIVFITAFISYAIEGYKVDAVRYLLKEKDNFEKSLEECINTILVKMDYKVVKERFSFLEGERYLDVSMILYVESKLHKLEFCVMDNELVTYSLYNKLDTVEEILKQYGFIRIHKSFLVNIKQICEVNNHKVFLSNGLNLPISKAKYKLIKETFIEYKGDI